MVDAFGATFDIAPGYLNTASIGVPTREVADAFAAAVQDWRGGAAAPPDFDAPVAVARAGFAALTGFPVEQVAIGSSASPLVGTVAAGLPDGAKVLVAEGEFTSVTWPFAVHAGRGVTVVEAPLEKLAERAEGFDLVAVSVVQSADGRIVDLDALRAVRDAGGPRVLLDASQSLGWFDGDLSWADAVVAAGYKFLLSPRGTAWLAVRPELPVLAHSAAWYAGPNPWTSVYGLPLRLADGARALDTSPVWYSQAAAAVALPWLTGLDRAAVHAHCVGLADALRAGLGLEPAGSAITSIPGEDAVRRLTEAGLVVSARAGAARLAFYLHNTLEDVERAVAALS